MNNYPMPVGLSYIFTAPSLMLQSERLMLFSLLYSLKPRNYMEIGTAYGGSAYIAHKAMLEYFGKIICVDCNDSRLKPEIWEEIQHRTKFYHGATPSIFEAINEDFHHQIDFLFVDGSHKFEDVIKDISHSIPLLADNATILCHDAYNYQVEIGIDKAILHDTRFTDCGLITTEKKISEKIDTMSGEPEQWGGLRLLKFRSPA